MNAVGKNLKQLRQREKLTQDALAERLHVTRQAVSSWETGQDPAGHRDPDRTGGGAGRRRPGTDLRPGAGGAALCPVPAAIHYLRRCLCPGVSGVDRDWS